MPNTGFALLSNDINVNELFDSVKCFYLSRESGPDLELLTFNQVMTMKM